MTVKRGERKMSETLALVNVCIAADRGCSGEPYVCLMQSGCPSKDAGMAGALNPIFSD
jgi:hypothetical protein